MGKLYSENKASCVLCLEVTGVRKLAPGQLAAGILGDRSEEHSWLTLIGPEFGQNIRMLAGIDRGLATLGGLLTEVSFGNLNWLLQGLWVTLCCHIRSIFIFSLRTPSVYSHKAFPISLKSNIRNNSDSNKLNS